MRSKLFGSSKGGARAKITLASILGCVLTLQLGRACRTLHGAVQ